MCGAGTWNATPADALPARPDRDTDHRAVTDSPATDYAALAGISDAAVAAETGCTGDVRTRRRWLGDVKLTVRTTVPDKSMRVTWPNGTLVELYFVAKGAAKSQVAVQHGKLPDRASVDRMKAYWTERLAALADVVSPSVTGASAKR